MGIHRLEGETEVRRVVPHFLAFFSLYVIWLYLLAVGAVGFLLRDPIVAAIVEQQDSGVIPASLSIGMVWSGLWVVALLLPATALSIVRADFRWLAVAVVLVGVGVAGGAFRDTLSTWVGGVLDSDFLTAVWENVDRNQINLRPLDVEPMVALIVGFIGTFAVEVFRASHTYVLTNQRLIARFGIFTKRERDLQYSKITDLIVHQGLLGRLFNFGTVVPITPGGVGGVMAGDRDRTRMVAGADGKTARVRTMKIRVGRGKTVSLPREASFYILWGVANPAEKRNLIVSQMQKLGESGRPRPPTRIASKHGKNGDDDDE